MRTGLVLLCAATLGVACAAPPPVGADTLHDGAITVGSFNFSESEILAEVYAQALEDAGYRVERQLGLGPRELVEPALERGLVELVPEYAGTLLGFLTGETAGSHAAEVHSSLVRELADRGLAALQPAEAQDRNAVVVTAQTATELHLRNISDLIAVEDRIAFGGPPECPQRPLCLEGLESTYGLVFGKFVPLDEGGPVTVAALASGQVEAALMFSSDGAIRANGFVVLRDDHRLQPAENVTPVVRQDVLVRFGPAVADVVNSVSARLATGDLRELNELVAVRGRSPSAVASDWLSAHGFETGVG